MHLVFFLCAIIMYVQYSHNIYFILFYYYYYSFLGVLVFGTRVRVHVCLTVLYAMEMSISLREPPKRINKVVYLSIYLSISHSLYSF